MPQTVNNPKDIAIVQEFFASLSRSERVRVYDFFKSRKFDENPKQRFNSRADGNDGSKIDKGQGNRQDSRSDI